MFADRMWTVLQLYFKKNGSVWISATLCGNADDQKARIIRQGTNHRGIFSRRQNKQMPPPLRGFLLSLCALRLLDYHSLCVSCVIADGLQGRHISVIICIGVGVCVVWVSHLKKNSGKSCITVRQIGRTKSICSHRDVFNHNMSQAL